jgi:hypothetical protein
MKQCRDRPNVEWLALLLHILQIPFSNLDPENVYPHWGVSLFRSVPKGKCCDNTYIQATNTSPYIVSNLLSSNHSAIPLYVVWATNDVVK